MDIRKRLHISNAVMIVVPAAIAVAAAAACAAVIWVLATGGAPLGSDALEKYLGVAGFSEQTEHAVKAAVELAAVVVLGSIAVTVALTDRFLTRFVLRHVTGPLDQLSAGVEQIRGGNLGYRIGYDGRDEFAPVCDAFDEMADRLAGSVERGRRSEEARKELIAGMSHDLRSPLTSIRGYAEGLRDGVAADEDARRRYVEIILDKTADIERKVSQLLTMTELDMDGYKADVRLIALDDYVRGFIEREERELAAQGMEVSCHLRPATVRADPAELDRIMGNLLDNSLKYRQRDKVAVDVRVDDAGGASMLTVSDDGPGVAEEDLARIFDPLYRGDAARGGAREGSGLGLSIVAAIARQMGGTVAATRSRAGGLSVRVSVPHAKEDEGADA